MPEALRDFLDRIGQPGSTSGLPPGLDGLVGSVPIHAPAPLPEGARFETLTYTNGSDAPVTLRCKLALVLCHCGAPQPPQLSSVLG